MGSSRFLDRVDAGTQLAQQLRGYAGRDDVTVLGLPRGGVPVAGVVAERLELPLEALVVRKVGVPGHRELAAGAIGPGDVTILDGALMARLGLTVADLQAVLEEERAERDRREVTYCGGRAWADLRERTVVVIDDGLATGATMAAAVTAVRACLPAGVVVAVPVASPGAVHRLRGVADDVVALITPPRFTAVGQWYEDFSAVPDEEVQRWLSPGARSR